MPPRDADGSAHPARQAQEGRQRGLAQDQPERADRAVGAGLEVPAPAVRRHRRGGPVHRRDHEEGRGPAMNRYWGLAAGVVMILAGSVTAGDWPQFRGPNGSAVADEANPPVKWSGAEGLRWKVDLPGRGVSNPVIAKGKV